MALWSQGLARSLDKLKQLYLQQHDAYGHQTGRMVTNLEGLLPIMLLDLLITRFCNITWQIKFIISPLPWFPWPPHFTGVWITMCRFFLLSHMTLWLRGLLRSRDKLKSLYLHYHNFYGHKTWQDGRLLWAASTLNVTWPYNQVILWDHVAN